MHALSPNTSLDIIAEDYPVISTHRQHSKLSHKYQQVTTLDVLRRLYDNGYYCSSIGVQYPRGEGQPLFAKHCVRLRQHDNDNPAAREMAPEVLLVNSHNGTSSFSLRLGFFRFVCSNGLVIGSDSVAPVRVRHDEYNVLSKVQKAVEAVELQTDAARSEVWTMKKCGLINRPVGNIARYILTEAFAYNPKDTRNEPTADFLRVLLEIGNDNTHNFRNVWELFNKIQSRVINGGYEFRNSNNHRRRAKPINSFQTQIDTNQHLWRRAVEVCKMEEAA